VSTRLEQGGQGKKKRKTPGVSTMMDSSFERTSFDQAFLFEKEQTIQRLHNFKKQD